LDCERVMLTIVDPETERLHPLVDVGWPAEMEQWWHAELGRFSLREYMPPPLIAQLRRGEVVIYDFPELTEAARRDAQRLSALRENWSRSSGCHGTWRAPGW